MNAGKEIGREEGRPGGEEMKEGKNDGNEGRKGE